MLTSGDSISTIEISNNTITHGGFFRAINVSITDNVGDTADLAITITNNNVNSTNAFALQPILVQGRNSGTICADISGNTVTVPNAAFTQDIRFRERDLSTVTLEQGGSISAVVATVLNDNNTLSQSAASVTGSPALVANGTCRDVP